MSILERSMHKRTGESEKTGRSGKEEAMCDPVWEKVTLPFSVSKGSSLGRLGDVYYLIDEETCFSRPVFKKGETVFWYYSEIDDCRMVQAVLLESEYENLRKIKWIQGTGDFMEFMRIANYCDMKAKKLDETQRKAIEQPVPEDSEHTETAEFSLGEEEAVLYYRLIRCQLPESVRTVIDGLLSGGSVKKGKDSFFRTLLHSYAPGKTFPVKDTEAMLECFDDGIRMYYPEEVRQIVNVLRTGLIKNRGARICLLGHPDTADVLIRGIKSAADLICVDVRLQDIDDAVVIRGADPVFRDADMGMPTRGVVQAGTTRVLMVFRNIDQARCRSRGTHPIYTISEIVNGTLNDEFLSCPVPLTNTTVVCTAEYEDEIPLSSLKTEFDAVIPVPARAEEMKYRTRHMFIPEIAFLSCRAIRMEPEAADVLIDEYCWTKGYKEIKSNLGRLFHAASDQGISEITSDFVRETLDRELSRDSMLEAYRNRDFYPAGVYEKIRKMHRQLEYDMEKGNQDAMDRTRLEMLVHLTAGRDENFPFDRESFLKQLNRTHYGQADVKKEFADCFFEKQYAGHAFSNLFLLFGKPGVGKSTLAESIANALGRPFVKLSMSAVSYPFELAGTFDEPGILAEKLNEAGLNAVILLDEIDSTNPLVMSSLLQLLDGSDGRRKVYNKFIREHIDLRNCLLIATANDVKKISSALLNRFQYRLEVRDYTREEKIEICRKHLIPAYLKMLSKFPGKIEIDPSVFEAIVDKYSKESGIRQISAEVKRLIKRRLSEFRESPDAVRNAEMNEYPVKIRLYN